MEMFARGAGALYVAAWMREHNAERSAFFAGEGVSDIYGLG